MPRGIPRNKQEKPAAVAKEPKVEAANVEKEAPKTHLHHFTAGDLKKLPKLMADQKFHSVVFVTHKGKTGEYGRMTAVACDHTVKPFGIVADDIEVFKILASTMDKYMSLSFDSPEKGDTLHIWSSYGAVMRMQVVNRIANLIVE